MTLVILKWLLIVCAPSLALLGFCALVCWIEDRLGRHAHELLNTPDPLEVQFRLPSAPDPVIRRFW